MPKPGALPNPSIILITSPSITVLTLIKEHDWIGTIPLTILLRAREDGRIKGIPDLAEALLMDRPALTRMNKTILALADYRRGDLAAALVHIQDVLDAVNGVDLPRISGLAVAALIQHERGNVVLAQDYLQQCWDGMITAFGLHLHLRSSTEWALASILAIEVRRRVLGDTLPYGFFWKHWERSLIVPDSAVPLVDRQCLWKYLHPSNGVDPASSDEDFHETFFLPQYDDTTWESGTEGPGAVSGFGYGDPVAVQWETPESGFRKSGYLRCRFETTAVHDHLYLRMQCDDGAIVYLDGKEVGRIGFSTRVKDHFDLMADRTVPEQMERNWRPLEIGGHLDPGEHVLAISLHNASSDSSDLRIGNITLFGVPVDRPVHDAAELVK